MSDFKIYKIKTKNKDLIKPSPLPQILPKHPARVMFSGASRSGKTNLIVSLLSQKRFLKGYFDLIFVFSPSAMIDDAWEELIPKIIPENHVFVSPDPETIEKILDVQNKLVEENGINKAPTLLCIFDDIIDNKTILTNKAFQSLFFRGRHFSISVWIASQSYNRVPRALRLQMSNLIIFKPRKSEAKVISTELTPAGMEEKQMIKILNHCTNEPYSFLHMNLQVDSAICFRKGLDTIVNL